MLPRIVLTIIFKYGKNLSQFLASTVSARLGFSSLYHLLSMSQLPLSVMLEPLSTSTKPKLFEKIFICYLYKAFPVYLTCVPWEM